MTSTMVTGAAPPSLLEKTVATGTAVSDVALRTAVATLVTASFVPVALSKRSVGYERDQLDFYAGMAATHDASQVFVEPTKNVPVRSRRVTPPPWLRGIGRIDLLSFESPFIALNPAAREIGRAHV